jgi:hypothetical protein
MKINATQKYWTQRTIILFLNVVAGYKFELSLIKRGKSIWGPYVEENTVHSLLFNNKLHYSDH